MAKITTPIYIYDRDEQLRLILNNLPGNFDELAVNEQNRNLSQSAGMFIGTMEVPHKQPIPQSDSGFLPYKNGWITEQLNGAVTLEFDVFANHPSAALIVNDGRAVTKDIDGNYMEFIIRVIDDDYGSSGTFKRVEAEGAEYELIDEFLPEYTQASVDLETALKAVTQGTRIEIGDADYLGQKPVSLKNMSVKRAVYELLNLFGAERRSRVEIAGNRITRRYLDALEHRGKNTGKRWEAGKDIISSTRTINSATVKTALYGRGSSQENDQPRLTFSEVEWVKANGDPTDKPLGQTWVGDVDALHTWGYEHGTRHKFGFYDGQENDPGVLLLNTWNDLQKIVKTTDTYDVKVIQLGEILDYEHEKVRLGDISYAINREVYPSMEMEASVIEYRHNLNQSDSSEATLGMFRAKFDLSGRFNTVEKDHNENRGNWTKKETPTGAQSKANSAETNAKTYSEDASNLNKGVIDVGAVPIRTATTGARIEFDGINGFVQYDANNNVVAHFTLTGDGLFKGDISGASGDFEGNLSSTVVYLGKYGSPTLYLKDYDGAGSHVGWTKITNSNQNTIKFASAGLDMIEKSLYKFEIDASYVRFNGYDAMHKGMVDDLKPATLQNGWVDYNAGYQYAAYWKDASGTVHLTGFIKGGASGSTALTLPVGYRPANDEIFIALAATTEYGRVTVRATGYVQPQDGVNTSVTTYVSLSGISFKSS